MEKLNRKIAVGAGWAVFTKLIVKSLGLVSTVILARLLLPEDFGVIAMCMVVVAFLEVFTRFGFDINIIQNQQAGDDFLNSAWTLRLLMGAILTIILVLISDSIGAYYDDLRISELILVVSILPILNSMPNIGFVLYHKELDLAKEFPLEVISKVVSFVVTVGFAIYLKNYWALVIGMYVNIITKVLISYILHPYRPKFQLTRARELLNFSKWLLLNNLLIFVNHKITDIIIGKQASADQLGYYKLGYEISNLPTTELLFPLSRSIFPGYAKIKEDKLALKTMFVKMTQVIVFMCAPVCFGIAITANEIVHVMLGDKWLEIIPIISILALYGFTRCCVQNTGSIFIVLGRPNIPTWFSLGRLTIIIPSLLYAVELHGALGASVAILLVSLITLPLSFYLIKKLLNLATTDIVDIFLFPVLASIVMYLAIFYIDLYFLYMLKSMLLVSLFIKVLVGLIIYCGLVVIYIRMHPTKFISTFIVNSYKKLREKLL